MITRSAVEATCEVSANSRAAALLAEIRALLPNLDQDEREWLAGGLGSLMAAACRPAALASRLDPSEPRLLKPEAAAEKIGKSVSWLYHNWKPLRLGRRVGGGLRFEEKALARFLRRPV